VAGRADAVSASAGERITLWACRHGLGALAGLVEGLALPCTFFWEARSLRVLSRTSPRLIARLLAEARHEHSCHALRHEDFSGHRSGVPLGRESTAHILREATDILSALTGSRPRGFRAPYCRLTPALREALNALGYRYDASLTRNAVGPRRLRPRRLRGTRVLELPLPRGRDRSSRPITGYLWQLFEGRRPAEDYIAFLRSAADACQGGLFQLALHPWHLAVDAAGRPFPPAARDAALRRLRQVLEGARGLPGVALVSLAGFLDAWQGGHVE